MPAPVSWPGTPTVSNLWASFPGGVGAPNVPIPLNGGARRSRQARRSRRNSRRTRRTSRQARRTSRTSRQVRRTSRTHRR